MPAPPTMLANVAPPPFPSTVRFLSADRDTFLAEAEGAVRAVRIAAGGGPVHVLALSGGGAGGAFAAGALVGLSRSGERPEFQIVTGVSAGALLAPFAFLGPEWDDQVIDAFASDRFERLLRLRGPGFFFGPSLYKGKPLVDLVNDFVTDRLIDAVAEQRTRGRLLFVATTDLDKEETVMWDMGVIAAQGGEAALELFRAVLVASASIPGLFPPVVIRVEGDGTPYDEMHADGGATVPFFLTAEMAQLMPTHYAALEGAKVFVIVNGQLSGYPETTRRRTMAVLSRSFYAGLKHSTRRALALSAEFSDRYDMEFRFSYIPVTYPYDGPIDFRAASLRALFDYGARCAQAGRLWSTIEQAIAEEQRTLTAPPEPAGCPLPEVVP